MTVSEVCMDCGVPRDEEHSGYGHDELCCDCFDRNCGMPLEQLYKEIKHKLYRSEETVKNFAETIHVLTEQLQKKEKALRFRTQELERLTEQLKARLAAQP